MDEKTLHPYEVMDAPTLRPYSFSEETGIQAESPISFINDWEIKRVIKKSPNAVIYLATGIDDENVAIKVYNAEYKPSPAVIKAYIVSSNERFLLTVRDHGYFNDQHYVVMPYLSEGSLEGSNLAQETIIEKVVPQLIHALFVLHNNFLLHNDIKPSNILWIKKNEELVLGDFDSVTNMTDNQKESIWMGTKEYMAPEVFNIGGGALSKASDYCSLGLTLISLIQGSSPLHGKTDIQMRRSWMRGIHVPDECSPQLKVLIKGLIQYEAKLRFDYSSVCNWMRTYNIEHIYNEEKDQAIDLQGTLNKPLLFGDEYIYTIDELVEAAGADWKKACFFLKQKQFSRFLRQFGIEEYKLCLECENRFNVDEGLFLLLHTLSKTTDFFWCGRHYSNLSDFSSQILDTKDADEMNDGAHFLRANLLEVYLKNLNADQQKIEFARNLSEVAKNHPELALTQLLTAMNEMPQLNWCSHCFSTLEELIDWLLTQNDNLDEKILDLYISKKFEAWLAFIHQGTFLNEIQNKMKGVIL